MAISVVQSKQPTITSGAAGGGVGTGAFAATTASLAFDNPTTTGNCIVIVVGVYYSGGAGSTNFAPSDNKGNTYTRAARGSRSASSNDCVEVWYCANATGGSGHTISSTNPSPSIYGEFALYELSGVDNTTPLDIVLTGGNAASSPNQTTFTTGFNNGSPNTLTLPTTSAPAAGGEFWVVAVAPGGGPGFGGGSSSITGSAALPFGFYSDYATSNNACWGAGILASSAAQSFVVSAGSNSGTDDAAFAIVSFRAGATGVTGTLASTEATDTASVSATAVFASFFDPGASGAVTLNPQMKGTDVTLSGGNLIATGNTGYSDNSHAWGPLINLYGTRLLYGEVVINSTGTGNSFLGFGVPDAFDGKAVDAIAFGAGSPDFDALFGSGVNSYGTHAAGDVIGWAVREDLNKVWFRKNGGNWNNTVGNDPVTGTGGHDISQVFTFYGYLYVQFYLLARTNSDTLTARFASGSWTGSPPSGAVAVTGSGMFDPGVATTGATWNPRDSATLTFSNGNKTVVHPGTFGSFDARCVRANVPLGSGKYHYEIGINNSVYDYITLGMGLASASLTTFINNGVKTTATGVQTGQTALPQNWVEVYTGTSGNDPTSNSNTVVAIEYDGTLKKFWFRGGGDTQWYPSGDPAAGTGGVDISALANAGTLYPMLSMSNGTMSVTGRFASADFTITPSSGFGPVAPNYSGMFDGAASGSVSASFSITGAVDTASFSAAIVGTGTLASTEAADTASVAVTSRWNVTLGVTDTADTASFSAGIIAGASFSITEAVDVAAFSAGIIAGASFAVTEAADTLAFTTTVAVISGNFAITEPADTAAFNSTAKWLVTLGATDTPDVVAVSAQLGLQATLSVTDGQDTASWSVTLAGNASTLAVTESPDTAALAITARFLTTLAASEGQDTAALAVTAQWLAPLAATESADTSTFAASTRWAVTLGVTDTPDVAAFTLGFPALVQLSATGPADVAAVAVTVTWAVSIFDYLNTEKITVPGEQRTFSLNPEDRNKTLPAEVRSMSSYADRTAEAANRMRLS